MYSLTKNKTKQFFIVLLALLMAITMLFASACKKDDDNGNGGSGDGGSTTTETTLTDYQVLKNGDFEYMTDEKTEFPKSSSIAWANSLDSGLNGNTAPSTSSNGKSGIIDTLDDDSTSSPYKKLSDSYKPKINDTTFYNPQTPFYYGLVENEFVDDVESANYEDNKTKVNAKGTKILMIQNKTSNENIVGTAQKFKSSTALSITSDSYAEFSVWVKTKDLKSTFTQNPGAYIALDFKVGTTTYDTIYFNNINTNGEWALLKAKIQGFEYGTTTAYVTFGLGKGNALGKTGYVEGFAYFDNAHFEVFNKQEFNHDSDEVITVNKEENASIDMAFKTYKSNTADSQNKNDKFSTFTYKLNLRQTDGALATAITGNVTLNTDNSYNTANGIETSTEKGVATKATVPASLTDKVADIDKIGGTNDTSVIYFNFNKLTSATYLSNEIALEKGKYNMVTFYVKSNAVRLNSDKVSVSVIDYVNDKKESSNSAFSSFTTQEVEEGSYGKWVKYTIMVNNPTDKDAKYKINITFGPSKSSIKNDALFLQSGYALIADLKTCEIEEDLYNLATTDSTFTKVTLKGEYGAYGEESEDETNDIYNTNVDGLGKLEIVNKETTNIPDFTRKDCGEGVISGVINSKYNANYTHINNLDNFAKLYSNNNKYAQAVVLQNNVASNSALISSAKNIGADKFVKIAIKLNVSQGATANVYLSTNKLIENSNKYKVLDINPNSETYNWSKELKAKVTGENKDTWTEVAFYVAAGNETIDYRVEIWLGDRNGEDATKTTGTMFVENVIVSDYTEADFMYAKDLFIDAHGTDSDYEAFKHTRTPATVKETIDGEDVTSTKYYSEREIYNGNGLTKFVDYTTIFADTEIDNTTKDEDADTDHDHEQEGEEGYTVKTDAVLQISSIIIAVVLIAVMIIVLIRTTLKNRRNRKEYVASFYDRNSREKTMKKINAKKAEVVLDETSDAEYNYEEAENVEENVIDVNELNKNPEDLQEDGGSEETTNEEATNEEPSSEN